MEINPDILKLLVTISEILDKIKIFEEWPDESLLSNGKNSSFKQNPLEFLKDISDRIEKAIDRGYNHIHKPR